MVWLVGHGIATQGTGLFSLSGGLTSAAVDPVNRLFCFINGTTLYVYDIDHDNSLGGNDFNNWETYSIGAGHDDGTLLYHANSNAFIQGK